MARHRGAQMPTSYRIDENGGIGYLILTGTTTESEWIETRAGLEADPRFQPGMTVLVDSRRHESVPSTEFIRTLAAGPGLGFEPDGVRRGAIVVSRQVSYGLGRMFALLVESRGMEVRVFRDIGDAERWLRDGRVSEGSGPVGG